MSISDISLRLSKDKASDYRALVKFLIYPTLALEVPLLLICSLVSAVIVSGLTSPVHNSSNREKNLLLGFNRKHLLNDLMDQEAVRGIFIW